MLETVGEYTDAAVEEIDGYTKHIKFPEKSPQFADSFKINHYLENSLPAQFGSVLKSEEDKQGTLPLNYGYLVFTSEVSATNKQFYEVLGEIENESTAELSSSEDKLLELFEYSALLNLDKCAFLFAISANIAEP